MNKMYLLINCDVLILVCLLELVFYLCNKKQLYQSSSPLCLNASSVGFIKNCLLYLFVVLNRFKKRRYHNTVNLLTGTTGVHPDLLMVSVSFDSLRRVPILITRNHVGKCVCRSSIK